jgi:hypothetical protein
MFEATLSAYERGLLSTRLTLVKSEKRKLGV